MLSSGIKNLISSLKRTGSAPAASEKFIFIVGFNKTGTRSLHHLFAEAGFSSIHNGIKRNKLANAMLNNILSGQKILSGFDQDYRVFSDMSFTNDRIDNQAQTYFRALDQDYPGALFIFNRRPVDNWIKSRANHHRDRANPLIEHYKNLYATDDPAEIGERWRAEFLDHEQKLRRYFAGSGRFLELDIENDDVVGLLSEFVGYGFDRAGWRQHGKTTIADSPTLRASADGSAS